MARPFLELTKLQNKILFEYVREQGFAEGVHKLYAAISILLVTLPYLVRVFQVQK